MFKISKFLLEAIHDLLPIVIETVENKDKLDNLKAALKDPAHIIEDLEQPKS